MKMKNEIEFIFNCVFIGLRIYVGLQFVDISYNRKYNIGV